MTQVEAVITAETIAHRVKGDLTGIDLLKLRQWLDELIDYVDEQEGKLYSAFLEAR